MATQGSHMKPSRDFTQTNAIYKSDQFNITATTYDDPIPVLTAANTPATIHMTIDYTSNDGNAYKLGAHKIQAAFAGPGVTDGSSYTLGWDNGSAAGGGTRRC
jgi:hypothetical protein